MKACTGTNWSRWQSVNGNGRLLLNNGQLKSGQPLSTFTWCSGCMGKDLIVRESVRELKELGARQARLKADGGHAMSGRSNGIPCGICCSRDPKLRQTESRHSWIYHLSSSLSLFVWLCLHIIYASVALSVCSFLLLCFYPYIFCSYISRLFSLRNIVCQEMKNEITYLSQSCWLE